MKTVNNRIANLVSGGSPLVIGAEAIIIGTGVYVAPQMIYDGTSFLNGVGSSVGEWAYNSIHPNEIGQMTYNAGDFGGSYILSACPEEFPPYG